LLHARESFISSIVVTILQEQGSDNTGIELSKKVEKPTELQVEQSGCALHGRWKLPL
jgi:hypothetical protein